VINHALSFDANDGAIKRERIMTRHAFRRLCSGRAERLVDRCVTHGGERLEHKRQALGFIVPESVNDVEVQMGCVGVAGIP
jgi:hypothetical protein